MKNYNFLNLYYSIYGILQKNIDLTEYYFKKCIQYIIEIE